MPPPRRVSKEKRSAQTVYAPKSVAVPLGGFRSTPLTQAIRCWAKILESASLEVQDKFTADEWAYLAAVCDQKEHSFDPAWNDPEDQLAQLAQRGADYEIGLFHLHKQKAHAKTAVSQICERLKELDYVHAWAVIWAIQWRADWAAGKPIPEGEEWWTLGHRQKHSKEGAA